MTPPTPTTNHVLLFAENNHALAREVKTKLEQEGVWVNHCQALSDTVTWIMHNRHQPPAAVIIDVPKQRSTQSVNAFRIYKLVRHGGWVPELEQRFDGWQESIPILMLVDAENRLEIEERMYALDIQPDRIDYSTPFRPHILMSKLRTLLQKESIADDQDNSNVNIIRIRSLRIDPELEAVSVGTEPIKLSQLEFHLLYYLASHPDVPISRETLLEDIWGITGKQSVNNRNVDVYIGRLRKKLKHTECADLIGRGHGGTYVLETNNSADDLTEPEGANLQTPSQISPLQVAYLKRVSNEQRLPSEMLLTMGQTGSGNRGDLKIGRNGNMSDFVITDKRVSRWHATIFIDEDMYYLRDENSTGGTYIARAELMHESTDTTSTDTKNIDTVAIKPNQNGFAKQKKQLAPRQHVQLQHGDHIYFNTIAYRFEIHKV